MVTAISFHVFLWLLHDNSDVTRSEKRREAQRVGEFPQRAGVCTGGTVVLQLKAGVSGREPMQFACKYVQLAPCCYDNGTRLQELLGIERRESKKIYKTKYFPLQNAGAPTASDKRGHYSISLQARKA